MRGELHRLHDLLASNSIKLHDQDGSCRHRERTKRLRRAPKQRQRRLHGRAQFIERKKCSLWNKILEHLLVQHDGGWKAMRAHPSKHNAEHIWIAVYLDEGKQLTAPEIDLLHLFVLEARCKVATPSLLKRLAARTKFRTTHTHEERAAGRLFRCLTASTLHVGSICFGYGVKTRVLEAQREKTSRCRRHTPRAGPVGGATCVRRSDGTFAQSCDVIIRACIRANTKQK